MNTWGWLLILVFCFFAGMVVQWALFTDPEDDRDPWG